MNMNRKMKVWTLAAALVALRTVGLAASDDAVLVLSTRGPDHYADGAPVQEGELYALVWMRAGCAFAGFDLNGAVLDAANSELVTAQPLAKYSARRGGVHCPATLFQIDAGLAKRHRGGTYALALLDTRVADGRDGLRPSGRLGDLKGWGLIDGSRVVPTGAGFARVMDAGGATGAVTTTAGAVPAGETLPQPRITGIQIEKDLVRLTVKGTSPRLLYNVAAGSRPDHRSSRRVARMPKQGHAHVDGEIELVVPAREDRRFFTVTQN